MFRRFLQKKQKKEALVILTNVPITAKAHPNPPFTFRGRSEVSRKVSTKKQKERTLVAFISIFIVAKKHY